MCWKYCPAEDEIETAILLVVIPPRNGGIGSIALLKKGLKPNTAGS
jgi:hypothetical protein